MKSIGLLWAQYGPYHTARGRALEAQAAPDSIHLVELSSRSRDYDWVRPESQTFGVHSLFTDTPAEDLNARDVFRRTRRWIRQSKLDVCLLPGYSPKTSFAALLAVKSAGVRTVMMNESHAGTAQATGARALLKGILARSFDAALVGGSPHKRYFSALGLPADRIFVGYDCVDNEYFTQQSELARRLAADHRARLGLPGNYFLSVSRMVAKKNLSLLIRAYHLFRQRHSGFTTHLVMVGSGAEEPELRRLCVALGLPVYRHEPAGGARTAPRGGPPGVHFFGFRQIEENPVFYALADAFILPSWREEWGLVVNEAMACGLSVVVSEKAGCVEDLLEAVGRAEHPATPTGMNHLARRLRRNGFACDPGSVGELSDILTWLAGSEALRWRMGRASSEIIARFSCRRFAENALRAVQVALDGPA